MAGEQQDVDGRDDPALAQAAARRSSGIAREQDAADAGHPAPSGSSPAPVPEGTAAGNPVAGREVDPGAAAAAVEASSEEQSGP